MNDTLNTNVANGDMAMAIQALEPKFDEQGNPIISDEDPIFTQSEIDTGESTDQ